MSGNGRKGKAEVFRETDIGNAERLVARHGRDLRYVATWKKWLVWDGKRFVLDDLAHVEELVKETVRGIYDEIKHCRSKARKTELFKHALASERNGRVHGMIERARVERGVPIRHTDLDTDPWALVVNNGTLDLRTGELRPHSREDLATKVVSIDYEPTATCPKWLAFLDRIMNGNAPLIAFLKRAVGYSLTGNIGEQCLFFLHGAGSNGKTTFVEVVRRLAGEYAVEADFATFLEKKMDAAPRNDLARLVGARLVTASEASKGRRIDEGIVKKLTGGGVISARFLYAEAFEFAPQFKVWLQGNHKPVIHGTDDGIWRRIRLVPFSVRIPEAERELDYEERLFTELPGILAWAVEGCLEWLEYGGLRPPAEVIEETKKYRAESDVLGAWLAQACVMGPDEKTPATMLYKAYRDWAEAGQEYTLSQTAFGRELGDRGITAVTLGSGANKRVWRVGVRLLQQPQDGPATGAGGQQNRRVEDDEPELTHAGGVRDGFLADSVTSPNSSLTRPDFQKNPPNSSNPPRAEQLEVLSAEEEAEAIAEYARTHRGPRS